MRIVMNKTFIMVLYAYFFVGVFFVSEAQISDQKVADSLYSLLQSKKDIGFEEKFELLVKIASNENNLSKQKLIAEKALQISLEHDRIDWQAKSYYILGQCHSSKGDLDKSLGFLIQSLKLYDKLENLHGQAALNNEIASLYHRQRNHQQALSYYRNSAHLYKKINYPIGIGSALLNIGEEYRLFGDLDSALFYFNESVVICSKENYDIGYAYGLGNIGLVHAALNQNDSAEYYILQATEILEELGDRYPIAVYNTYMADIYKDKGDWDAALNYAHHSLQIAEEEGLKEQIRDASLKLSELYRDREEFEKAYRYQNQYIIYRDSINNEEVIRKMADLRTEYEVSRKQIEVDLLEQKNKTQSVLNQGLAIIIFLMFVLGLLIYQNSKKRKEVNELLSEQKEEIATQRDQLEELVSMKDRFFGIISHDLRSPVNSLQGITQLLRHYVTVKQTDQIEEFVSLADQSINNLSSLLDNLLSWALSQQGSLPYRPEKFRYYYVAEEVRRIFSNVAVSKKIDFTTSVPKDVELYADRDSVFALTRNLVNNAIKFTRESGEVRLYARMTDDYTEIIVEDTGVGIPEETLKKLFEFDKKKSTKGTAGEKGSGLGLALCKDIVELNHGKIEVQSQEGQGTKFVICLPSNTPVESSKKELI